MPTAREEPRPVILGSEFGILTDDIAPQPDEGEDRPALASDSLRAPALYFRFDNSIHVGDCIMDPGAVMVLHHDGNWTMEAVVWSRDTNDRWQVSFSFYDEDGVFLAGCNTKRVEYLMGNSDQKYRWIKSLYYADGTPHDINGTRAANLGIIERVRMRCSC